MADFLARHIDRDRPVGASTAIGGLPAHWAGESDCSVHIVAHSEQQHRQTAQLEMGFPICGDERSAARRVSPLQIERP